jgi:hypothetical protein
VIPSDYEKTALMVHELVHADQDRRPAIQMPETDEQYLARHEAEGYAVQYAIMNHYFGGALDALIAINKDNSDITHISTGGTGLRDALTQASDVPKTAVAAVIRNTVHGYPADGITVPSTTLAAEYVTMDLVSTTETW